MQRRLDEPFLQQHPACVHVPEIEALERGPDLVGAELGGELAHEGQRVDDVVVSEVDGAAVETGHLRLELHHGAEPLLGRVAHRSARGDLHDDVRPAPYRGDHFLEPRGALGGRSLRRANVKVENGRPGLACLVGGPSHFIGRHRKRRVLRLARLRPRARAGDHYLTVHNRSIGDEYATETQGTEKKPRAGFESQYDPFQSFTKRFQPKIQY